MSFAGAALLKGLPGEYLHSEAGSKKKNPVRVLRASIVISFCKAVTKKRGNFFKK